MATLAASFQPLLPLGFLKAIFEPKQQVAASLVALPHEAALFTHALAALAAKLSVVDGHINKAEYHAFEAMFIAAESDGAKLRSQFVKHLEDRSSALQFARQITRMTGDDLALRTTIMRRLVTIATADAALNAAEMEWLRAVADVFGIARDDFRELVAAHMQPAQSPYAVLGVPASIGDAELRARYMAQVNKLHPDRYQAAGASAETVALLSDQLAAVNAAYQAVRTLRAKKHAPFFGRKTMKGAKAAA